MRGLPRGSRGRVLVVAVPSGRTGVLQVTLHRQRALEKAYVAVESRYCRARQRVRVWLCVGVSGSQHRPPRFAQRLEARDD
eukprot:4311119-Pleurochrysis_carterae.AAC.1